MSFEGDVRQSGCEASEAFPSQQVVVFGPGDTAPSCPLAGLPAWRGQSGDQSGDVRQSGREASEAFPSQQVLVFGPGDTASVGPVGWFFGPGEASLGGSVATLGGLSASPFLCTKQPPKLT